LIPPLLAPLTLGCSQNDKTTPPLQVVVVTRLIPEACGTTCNERVERIHSTEGAYILRIPFRDPNTGQVRRAVRVVWRESWGAVGWGQLMSGGS
jgi:hypothetical protein